MTRVGGVIAMWIALVALPFWLPWIGGYTALGSKVLIYAIATMGLNLILGFTGGLSFGQAAYFGLGAYGAGMTLKYLAPSTPLAILIGTLAGGLAATLVGPLVMRRRGIYFAMITIALGQLFYFIVVRWNEVTGGEDGLAGFSRQDIHLGSWVYRLTENNFYYLVLLCFTIAVVIMWITCNRHLATPGLRSARTDAASNFSVSALSAMSGRHSLLPEPSRRLPAPLMHCCSTLRHRSDLHWILSGNFVIMIVLGGMRSFFGPLVGVVIFVVAQDYLSSVTGNWMTFIGMIFVSIVLLFPKGILGVFNRRAVTT